MESGSRLGVDRILLACDAEGVFAPPATALDVFVVDVVDGSAARDITHALRAGRGRGRPPLRWRFDEVADEVR